MKKVGRVYGRDVFSGKRGGIFYRNANKRIYLNEHDRLLMMEGNKHKKLELKQLPNELTDIINDYKQQLDAERYRSQIFVMLCTRLERLKVVGHFLCFHSPHDLHNLYKFVQHSYSPSSRIYRKALMASMHW